jgi:hypothetical protein
MTKYRNLLDFSMNLSMNYDCDDFLNLTIIYANDYVLFHDYEEGADSDSWFFITGILPEFLFFLIFCLLSLISDDVYFSFLQV